MNGPALRPDPRLEASRAYSGEALAALNQVNFEITNIFNDAGFEPIEPPILQPAEMLFDLYGEEIWERAFVVEAAGEPTLCLRPDFTAPVAQAFLQAPPASGSARYGYFGPVFRSAAEVGHAPLQHLQAGVEVIGEPSPAALDAEVFDLASKGLKWCGCETYDVMTGDLSVMFSLLDRVAMPDGRRTRLKRHFWRPKRFQSLLRRYASGPGGHDHAGLGRLALLKGVGALDEAEATAALTEAIALAETPHVGKRSQREVADRLLRQAAEAREAPLSGEVAAVIETVLATRGPSAPALTRLRDVFRSAEIDIGPALDRMEARLEAMSARGVDIYSLPFDAAFGRNLEYYDGFVFEMTAVVVDEAAPQGQRVKLGGGGRYDRLFEALGAQSEIGGVGAALRPEAIVAVVAQGGGAS